MDKADKKELVERIEKHQKQVDAIAEWVALVKKHRELRDKLLDDEEILDGEELDSLPGCCI